MSLLKIKKPKNLNSKIIIRNIIFLILQKKNFMKKFIKDKVNSVRNILILKVVTLAR